MNDFFIRGLNRPIADFSGYLFLKTGHFWLFLLKPDSERLDSWRYPFRPTKSLAQCLR